MKETSKMFEIRKERGDFEKYLKGTGIDIGAGDDPLEVPEGKVLPWDLDVGGDATYMEGAGGNWDFVYSSHCLEHLDNVELALKNWVRILKPGGYLYVVVPDFGLYEKFCFPSRFNAEHKSTFSLFINREQIGRKSHYGWREIGELLKYLGLTCYLEEDAGVCDFQMDLESFGYDFSLGPEVDQTLGNAVAQICIIAQKYD